ncbi:MAG: hypothetical protein IJ870_04295 [Alphaproteobacteria bacterium]|nr:hypothetical protein [Alphaproteobacteria bacterium]
MQKNNVKSFICSFIFSILAVFAVQKVFLHTPEIKNEPKATLKPQKISLFSENKIIEPKAASQTVDVSQISDLTAPEQTKPETNVAQNTFEQKPFDNIIYSEQKELPAVQTDLAFASEIKLDADELTEIKENKEHLESGIVYADISDTFEKNQGTTQNDEEEIPLFENLQTLHQHINVGNTSHAAQIAMVEPSALINTIDEPDILEEEKDLAQADIKKNELNDMFSVSQNEPQIDESAWEVAAVAEKQQNEPVDEQTPNQEDNPWVMAKGNKYAKNQAVVEAFSSLPTETQTPEAEKTAEEPAVPEIVEESVAPETAEEPIIPEIKEEKIEQTFKEPLLREKQTDTKLAYQMIQNILIPIPDDILNDADLTPDLTASPEGGEKDPQETKISKSKTPDLNEDEKKSGLLKSISSWFGKNKEQTISSTSSGKQGKKDQKGLMGTVKDKVFSALGNIEDYQKTGQANIMPAELRLSFQPNRAEISGQTLRWIYAFADNARDNNDIYVEVRIDGTSSYMLQQKRLNLLSSIFASRGLDYRKINTIFTSREPNSFIIRNIRFNNEEKGETNE